MKGLGISEGIAIGRAYIYQTNEPKIPELIVEDHAKEIDRFDNVREKLVLSLKMKSQKAEESGDQDRADVFMAHELIAEDPELIQGVYSNIREKSYCAEWALRETSDVFIKMMEEMDNEYLRQRAADIRDIRQQMFKLLMGIKTEIEFKVDDSLIMVGHEFNPSDIGLTEKSAVKGFLSEIGAATTHFSILAKISGIPTVANIDSALKLIKNDDLLIIDGGTGEIIVNPSQDQIDLYIKKQEREAEFKKELSKLKDAASVTKDGFHVEVIGNIAGEKDAESVNDFGAEGVGLFRTEFIYMDRNSAPTEEEQYGTYKKVLEALDGKPVVIRTMDVGGDKEIAYLSMPKEDNPFLGYRAIRYCLKEKEIFKTQIRAILRASVHGHAKIMIPMISTIDEVLEAKAIIKQCKNELIDSNISFSESVEVGIMIEVPSAGIISDLLAEEVDFFSIGTNDLIQYTMAADRMNKNVAYLYHPYHPSFLRMLKMVIDNAHKKGIKVAMCGELAGDQLFIPVLVGLGLDEFSMNGNSVLKARWLIRKLEKQSAEELVKKLLTLRTSDEIRKTIEEYRKSYN